MVTICTTVLVDSDGWRQETIPNSRRATLHMISTLPKPSSSCSTARHSLSLGARLPQHCAFPLAKGRVCSNPHGAQRSLQQGLFLPVEDALNPAPWPGCQGRYMLGQSSWFNLPETRAVSSSQGRVKSSKIKVPVPTALCLKTALLLPPSPSLCSEEEVSLGSSEPTEATTSSWWYQPALKAQPHLLKASLAKCQKGPEIRFGCKQGEVWKEARPCQQSKALGAQH